MTGVKGWSRTRWGAAALMLAALCAAVVGSASADPTDKEFSAAIAAPTTPPTVVPEDDLPADTAVEAWAGSSFTLRITLTNETTPQSLGSADIDVPSGITLVSAPILSQPTGTAGYDPVSRVIRLRNLALESSPGSVTVSASARATCSPTAPAYQFTTRVKQSNDFNGTGNDFIIQGPQPALDLVGRCSVDFVDQPADAAVNASITSEIYLPSGAPITARVVDGGGDGTVTWWTTPITLSLAENPGGATLQVATATPDSVTGIASFTPGPSLDKSSPGYILRGASTGVTDGNSTPFDIVDAADRCDAGDLCSGQVPSSTERTSYATVQGVATGDDDLLKVSLIPPAAPNAPAFDCAAYTATTEVLDFDITTIDGEAAGGPKTAVFTLRKPFVTRAAGKYDACFLVPLSVGAFPTSSGAPATAVDTDGIGGVDSYQGLLPTCSRRVPAPCVQSRIKERSGDITLTILTKPGDPRVKF